MLNHIAFGPLAINPARKCAIPFVIKLVAHNQLHKGARFGEIFPWRGLLAGAQPHQRIANAL